MSNSFLIISRDIFSESKYRDKLTNDDIVAYILLGDRFKISLKNKWFDHKFKATFVNYKIDDLAHDLRVSPGKAVKILKDLKNVGLIKKRRMFKQANRLFLPNFKFRNTVITKIKKQSNNKSNNNKVSDNKTDKRVKKSRNRWQSTNIPKIDSKLDHQNAIKAIKYKRIPKPVVSLIESMFNGKTLTKCIHVILEAKKSVFKDHQNSKKYTKILRYALDFDINEYYTFDNSKGFVNYLSHGLRKAWHCARYGKLWNYVMKVCKTYFGYALKYYYNNQPVKISNQNGPDIPIFRI